MIKSSKKNFLLGLGLFGMVLMSTLGALRGNMQAARADEDKGGWDSYVTLEDNVGNGYSCYDENGLLFTSNDGHSFLMSKRSGKEISMSAMFTKESENAQAAGLVFGVNDGDVINNHYVASVDLIENKVNLWKDGVAVKSVNYDFSEADSFLMTVVVNQGIAKVWLNDDTAAAVVCAIDGDYAGKVGVSVYNGSFHINELQLAETVTVDGKFNLNGEKLVKLINLSDGNSKLSANDYSVEKGIVTIAPSYLKAQEANEDCLFNVVTERADYLFSVANDFTAVSVQPAVDKIYQGDKVTLEMSSNAKVTAVTIDGQACTFTQNGETIVLDTAEATIGKHSVKVYTDNGRPETSFTVKELITTMVEMEEKANHIFFWVDISIFVGLIVGYVGFSTVQKYRK